MLAHFLANGFCNVEVARPVHESFRVDTEQWDMDSVFGQMEAFSRRSSRCLRGLGTESIWRP